MAATNVKPVTSGVPGGYSNLRFVTADIDTEAAAAVTVTAVSIGLKKIHGFAGAVWGATSTVVESLQTNTAYVSGGVTTLELEVVVESGSSLDRIQSVLFWGT